MTVILQLIFRFKVLRGDCAKLENENTTRLLNTRSKLLYIKATFRQEDTAFKEKNVKQGYVLELLC